jgi:integrase
MATVRKRTWKAGAKEKTAWVADYFDQDGKRHIKTFPTQKAAKGWLDKTKHEVTQGIHTPESTSITVAEAADIWIDRAENEGRATNEQLERSTVREYRNHVRLHIKPSRIGNEKLARLSRPMIVAFRDDLLRTCSRAMARKVLTSLKSILSKAQDSGLVAQNVAQSVRVDVKKRDQRQLATGTDIPSKEEVQKILSKAAGRWRPFLITAVFTGMRASELRGLTWDDVDFAKRVIHVRQRANLWGEIGAPKSAASRRAIPMTPMVVNALKEWKLACPKGEARLVFPNGAGKVENHANIANRGFYALQLEADIVAADGKPKYGLHALRHFFASWVIEQCEGSDGKPEAGFSPKQVQALLGHSSIQMTFDRYGHLFPSPEDDHAKLAARELDLVRLATKNGLSAT